MQAPSTVSISVPVQRRVSPRRKREACGPTGSYHIREGKRTRQVHPRSVSRCVAHNPTPICRQADCKSAENRNGVATHFVLDGTTGRASPVSIHSAHTHVQSMSVVDFKLLVDSCLSCLSHCVLFQSMISYIALSLITSQLCLIPNQNRVVARPRGRYSVAGGHTNHI